MVVDKLPEIAAAWGVELEGLLLIFVVVSLEKAWVFKFPLLPRICMVVTPRNVRTKDALLTTGH